MLLALALLAFAGSLAAKPRPKPIPTKEARMGAHQFTVQTIDGHAKSLADYKGKILLIVNVASECGNTPQYAGLEHLHEKYADKGLAVLGFPSNDFGGQEPGTEAEIKTFCTRNYGVRFDMFGKLKTKGEGQSPLYHWLTTQPGMEGDVTWNFGKFLIGRDGQLLARFAPGTKPETPEVVGAIEAALK
jgi:glutathione peroxidase